MPPARRGLRLLTLNVNGMTGPDKAAVVVSFLASTAADVVCLQELKCADKAALEAYLHAGVGVGMPYHVHSYVSLGTSRSCGVAVLVRAGVLPALPDNPTFADAEGRICRLDVKLGEHKLSIISVYAPASGDKSAFFTDRLLPHLPPAEEGRIIIMGGDFNCIMHAMDQTNESAIHRFAGRSGLQHVMTQHDLVDAFREIRPTLRAYTHGGTGRQSFFF